MRSLYLKSRFPSDLKSINALNYLQVPSIDWSDSGYIQHFINVIEKMPTTNNDALIYIRDEFIDERKLRGESHETVIAIFNCELQNIFNQEIE